MRKTYPKPTRRNTLHPRSMEAGDILLLRKNGWITKLTRKGKSLYYLKLMKHLNPKQRWSWWKSDFSAKELSALYTEVWRDDKYIGSINTKYW